MTTLEFNLDRPFEEIYNDLKNEDLGPLFRNEDDEIVEATAGKYPNGVKFYQIKTYQENGWTRINIFYEDGSTEELFSKE